MKETNLYSPRFISQMSDTTYVHYVLKQGPATTNQILQRSFKDRGCGLTVHSRVSELRQRLRNNDREDRMYLVCRRLKKLYNQRKAEYQYELVDLAKMIGGTK